MHALSPTDAAKVPAEQLVQLDEVAAELKVPITQDEQTLAEAAEYVPTAQPPVTADSPEVAQYDPAVQAEHELEPADAWKVPATHEVQLEADEDE